MNDLYVSQRVAPGTHVGGRAPLGTLALMAVSLVVLYPVGKWLQTLALVALGERDAEMIERHVFWFYVVIIPVAAYAAYIHFSR